MVAGAGSCEVTSQPHTGSPELKLEVGQGYKLQGLPEFFQQGSPPKTAVTSPDCAFNQELRVQTHEPIRDAFHSNHHTFLDCVRHFIITGTGTVHKGLELTAASTVTSV